MQEYGIAKRRKNIIYFGIPAFLILGAYLAFWTPQFYVKLMYNAPVILGLILSLLPYIILLFGVMLLLMYFRFQKYWNNQLVISKEGFIDNAGFGFRETLISWKDIKGFKMKKVMRKNYMFIELNNEQKYLDKVSKNSVKNHLKKMKTHNGYLIGLAVDWYEIPSYEIIELFKHKIALNEQEQNGGY